MAEAKTLKVKKKKWYSILAPQIFRHMPIGEILLEDVATSRGRHVTANLMELTNDIKKQNINMKFIINKIEDNKLLTSTVGYEMIPASIKRMVRRGRERVDSSILCTTADNKTVRVKALLLTRSIVNGSIKASLFKSMNNSLIANIKRITYENLIGELVSHRLQKTMYSQLSKIYPLKTCEIREMKIEKGKKATPEQATEVKNEEVSQEPKEVVEEKPAAKEVSESKEVKDEGSAKEDAQEVPEEEVKAIKAEEPKEEPQPSKVSEEKKGVEDAKTSN